jgi:UDPglucose 6-dehydrogenase
VFIAVGTPSRQGDGHADLGWVYSAAQEIAANLKGFAVVVAKSTVPIGTGDEVERLIRESNVDADVGVASKIRNFFVKERLMSDFKHPDRIVVGDR